MEHTADAAHNEAFNDVHEPLRWERIWRQICAAFGLEAERPLKMTPA